MTPRINPLDLPEVVALVLQHLDDDAEDFSLIQCAQVNKLWAEEATSLLWLYPPVKSFNLLREARWPYYTRKICKINLSGPQDCSVLKDMVECKRLQWPRLRALFVCDDAYSQDTQILPYLKDQLDDLDIRGGVASDKVMSQLAARCPHLTSISLWYLPAVTADGFLAALESNSSIDTVRLWSMDQVVTTQLLRHLADRHGLKELEIDASIKQSDSSNSIWNTSSPFRQLVRLSLYAETRVVIDMLPYLAMLHEITFTLQDNIHDFLLYFPQCSKLTHLDVAFDDSHSQIRGCDLVHLARRCKGLKHLCLSSGAECNDLTDSHIAHFASLLKDLRYFKFDVYCNDPRFTIQSLKSLGRHCRKLGTCEIECGFALEDLEQEGPCLFPRLLILSLGMLWNADTPGSELLRSIESVLKYHFPELCVFNNVNGNILRSQSETGRRD